MLAAYNDIPTIVLDFPSDGELVVRQGLASNPLPGLLRVDGPKRSLGNTTTLPRSTISMAFSLDTISDIELRIFPKNSGMNHFSANALLAHNSFSAT